MELSEIYNALETAEGLELEDVFYSDFLGTDELGLEGKQKDYTLGF